MKKYCFQTFLFLVFFTIFSVFSSGRAFANSCAIASWPISEMTDYSQRINQEMSEIITQARASNPSCKDGHYSARSIKNTATAGVSAYQQIASNFRFQTRVALKGDNPQEIVRDQEFFRTVRKNFEQSLKELDSFCGITSNNSEQLIGIYKEILTLEVAYERAAIGEPLVNSPNIRAGNNTLVQKISQAYSPEQASVCKNNSPEQKRFEETLKDVLNLGGKMDDALSTWRKALALFAGGGSEMTASEYAIRQEQLLNEELDRQWLSHNAKNVMLKNFNCYKQKTSETNGSPENILQARAECLQKPITGIENLYIGWNNFVWSSPNSDTFAERQIALNDHKTRSINIEEMYHTLSRLITNESDVNDDTQKSLIDLHISLEATNNLLENRIPAMQQNCLKWQPDIVGGCR